MRRAWLAAVVAAAAVVATARQARAQLIVELLPTLSTGATTNASVTGASNTQGGPDEFVGATGAARLQYTGRRTDQALAYRINYTRFLSDGASALQQDLGWLSTFNLLAALDLRLGANAAYSNMNQPAYVDPTRAIISGAVDAKFASVSATEELVFKPNARRQYSQGLRFATFRYILPAAEAGAGPRPVLPTAYYFGGFLRSEWELARDTFSAELNVTDNDIVSGNVGLPQHTLLVSALAGWKRELSLTWSLTVQGGALGAFDLYGNGLVGPAGSVSATYRRLLWYATLTAAQQLSATLFVAAATINDQVTLRAVLPLTRSELLSIAGYGGYIYARFANSNIAQRAYDLAIVGASLTARGERLPFFAALNYSFSDQRGNLADGGDLADIKRHTVMLIVGGAFVFGPGTPPVLQGGAL